MSNASHNQVPLEEAITAYRQALQLDPNHAKVWIKLQKVERLIETHQLK